jgi:NAD(P)-dependent dehydrogenase (short-subunit alcohol dehydrogenase family)
MSKGSKLEGRRVLITGAARGIGAAVARALAERGARVALVGLEPELLRAGAQAIGERAVWHEADVTDAAAVARATDDVAARLGGLDAVFANAGIANFAPLRAMDTAQMRRVLDVNVLGVFHTLHAALPHLVASRGYALLNASLAAALGPPGFGAYSASKAAVESMGDVLRQEVRHLGVDVGVSYYGFIATDMVDGADSHPGFAHMRTRLPPPVRRTTPLAEAVAAAVRGIEKRATRVIVPGGLKALLPLRWLLALSTPRQMSPAMPEIERLCAETDARYGGVAPTTERPDDLRRGAAR